MGWLWRQGGGRAVRSESYPSQPYSTRSRHDYNLPPKSSFPSRGLVVRVLGRSPCLFFSCFIAKINNRVCNHVFFSFSSLDFQTYLHFCCVCFWLDYVFIARVGARVDNVVLHCVHWVDFQFSVRTSVHANTLWKLYIRGWLAKTKQRICNHLEFTIYYHISVHETSHWKSTSKM